MEQPSPAATSWRDIYTVSRLNREAKAILEGSFPPIWIEGEISNLSRPASGHLYFSLKDAQAQVRCAFFRQYQRTRGAALMLTLGLAAAGHATGTRTVWQIVNIWEASDPFRRLIHNPAIVGAIASLTGFRDLQVWHDQVQYKPPTTITRSGGRIASTDSTTEPTQMSRSVFFSRQTMRATQPRVKGAFSSFAPRSGRRTFAACWRHCTDAGSPDAVSRAFCRRGAPSTAF